MANLILTNKCNQRCSYCFAGSFLQSNKKSINFISEALFEQYLDYLDRSGIHQVRLLGGEPTLHPQFPRFILAAHERGKNIIVFTNGLMPRVALEALLQIPVEHVNVLVNVTTAKDAIKELKPRQYNILTSLGQRAHLGYTIFRPDTNGLFYLKDIIEKTQCRRSIRIGLSHPAPGGNTALSPKHYRRIAKGVLKFIRSTHEDQIKVEFDCGFVRCMFTDGEILELETMEVNFGWRCNPVIDITGDGSAVPCFPLSSQFHISNAFLYSEQELMDRFSNEAKHLRFVGIFGECSTCTLRVSENCSGGCLSAALLRMHTEPVVYNLP